MGLIKYQKGKIIIDNKELSRINLNSFYDNVTYVSQEAPIFDGTLRENLIFDKTSRLTVNESVDFNQRTSLIRKRRPSLSIIFHKRKPYRI